MKKQFTAEQKAAVALAAIRGEKTTSEISSAYEVHSTQVGLWKKQALEGMKESFSDKRKNQDASQQKLIDELYKTIGTRDMELEWLKKKIDPFLSR